MQKPIFIDTVTEIPADFMNLVADLVFGPLNQAVTVPGVLAALNIGTIASQNANAVAITGGTLDGVAIGNTTQATGKFSALYNYGVPTDPHHAANKAYVDSQISGAGLNPNYVALNYLPLAGGTMTGALTLFGAPTAAFHAATKLYVDTVATGFVTMGTFNQALSAMASESYVDSLYAQQAAREMYHDSFVLNGTTNVIYLREKPAGDVMVWYNGAPVPRSQVAVSDTFITLPFNPNGSVETLYFGATGTGAQFVGYLPLAGGTMTGALLLNADPITGLQAATKQYVDNTVSFTTAGLVTKTALSAPSGAAMVGYQGTTVAATLATMQSTFLTDAPNNGSTYLRKSGAWAQVNIPTLLSQLNDVNVLEGPGINGFVLTYNNAISSWQATAPSAGVTQLSALSDVNVTPGAGINGYALTYNSSTSKWVAAAIAAALSGLTDVNVAEGAAIDRCALIFDVTTNKWIAVPRAYDFAFSIVGTSLNSEQIPIAVVRACSLPIGLTGSTATALVAATATTVYNIVRNGTVVGTVTFAAGARVGTFSFTSAITLSVGDTIEIDAPTLADATLAGVAITIKSSW